VEDERHRERVQAGQTAIWAEIVAAVETIPAQIDQ
jgi:hypothetical protein